MNKSKVRCSHCNSIVDDTWPPGLVVIRRDGIETSWCWYAGGDEEANSENKLYEKDGCFEVMRFWATGCPDRKLELDRNKFDSARPIPIE